MSHAITNSWKHFAETILPAIAGNEYAEAHVAYYFGAYSVLKILQQIIAQRSGEEVPFGVGMLDREVEQFMKAHAVTTQ